MPMPKSFIIKTVICLLIIVTFGIAESMEDNEEKTKPEFYNKDLEEIIDLLHYEKSIDKECVIISNTHNYFDTAVGEILRRKDKRVIKLLIEKVNSEEELIWGNTEDQQVTFRYDSPVLLKYKVRFVLQRLLGSELYHKVFLTDERG